MLKNNGFHNRHSPFSRPFSPASFFANGEQGWWYDPSNFATLFQDSAGTTPVTAVEQPVGLQLDLSKGLVLGPELVTNGDFSGGTTTGWTPNGTATPTLSVVSGELRVSIASATGQIRAVQTLTLVLGKTYKLVSTTRRVIGDNTFLRITSSSDGSSAGQLAASVNTATSNTEIQLVFTATATTLYLALGVGINSGTANLEGFFDNITVKELPGNHRFQSGANRPVVSARVNLFVGTATLATQSVTTRATTHTLTFTGAGSITLTGTVLGVYTAGTHSVTTTAGTLTATVLGTVTQADLRETNVGVGLPAYQAVVTSTNYDSVGFPTYIKPNGSNQFMVTNSINFSVTDKMTVWQGVRKLSDAAFSPFIELSASAGANIGAFNMSAPGSTGVADYGFSSRGTAGAEAKASGYAAPITNVLTGIGNISGDLVNLRVNGALVSQSTADQGTGNYGNWPAYFYARNAVSNFFNGHDYGSIARGAASTAAQITDGETYINSKTKAY